MQAEKPSLEALVEAGELEFDILHPGGLKITRELAELCRIAPGKNVLDVASGTGESACFLAEEFKCRVVGLDASRSMVEKAREKASSRGLNIDFRVGDAHNLPFHDNTFDAVISECTLSLLDKKRVLEEMVRVVKPGGYVGIHDVCWKDDAPEKIKRKLKEIEGEEPETPEGWRTLFEGSGLTEIKMMDRSSLLYSWVKDIKRKLGLWGQVRIFFKVLLRFGLRGCLQVYESGRIFQSGYLGYVIVAGKKPGGE